MLIDKIKIMYYLGFLALGVITGFCFGSVSSVSNSMILSILLYAAISLIALMGYLILISKLWKVTEKEQSDQDHAVSQ